MKILVLGSTGAVGTAIEEVCGKKEIECIGLTHTDIEITNPDMIKSAVEKHKPDVVVNAVAIIGINICEIEPQKTFNINSIAVSNLAKICEEKKITLVQPSTHAIFDGTKDDYYTEDDLPNPTNIYSVSKYAAECFTQTICSKYYITRFPTLFGKRRNRSLGFIDKVLTWIENGNELRISDDKIDSPTYTMDAANMLISMLEEEKSFGVYHIANSGKTTYYDFVSKMVDILGTSTKLSRAKDKDFEPLAYSPLKTAMKSIKLEPMRSWQDALSDYIISME